MTKRLKVRFTAEFETFIDLAEGDHVPDMVSDIDIPERPDCEYVANSFDVQSVVDAESNKPVDWERDPEDEDDDDDLE